MPCARVGLHTTITGEKDTMRKLFRGFFISVLLGIFTVVSAQLPPKVIADKYLMQAEQLLEKQDYEAALNLVEKILALQKEHNLTLPDNLYFKDAVAQLLEKKDYIIALNIMDRFIALQKEHNLTLSDEFHFQYAQATFFKYEQVPVPADSIKVALDLVSKYLSAETEGASYKEALALLLKIEEKLEELEFSPDRTCAGKERGSSCWVALADHPECYVWNPFLMKKETWTWTGACSSSVAQGEGTLTWNYTDNVTEIIEATGYLQNGRKHGQWVERRQRGAVREISEGPYVHGTRHGQWVWPSRSGAYEGAYVNGKKHGQWIRSNGGGVNEESYVNGKRHGRYFERHRDGSTVEGSYVNGELHGRWVTRKPDGTIRYESTYENGKLLTTTNPWR